MNKDTIETHISKLKEERGIIIEKVNLILSKIKLIKNGRHRSSCNEDEIKVLDILDRDHMSLQKRLGEIKTLINNLSNKENKESKVVEEDLRLRYNILLKIVGQYVTLEQMSEISEKVNNAYQESTKELSYNMVG